MQYVDKEMEPPLPEVEGHEHLISLLENAGTILQTGMGIAPLTWQELESWERCYSKEINCWELSFWELNTLKDMSYAYCAELGNARDKTRPAPYTPPVPKEIDRAAVATQVMDVFKLFMKTEE